MIKKGDRIFLIPDMKRGCFIATKIEPKKGPYMPATALMDEDKEISEVMAQWDRYDEKHKGMKAFDELIKKNQGFKF